MLNKSTQSGSRNMVEAILVVILLVSLMLALYNVLKVFFGILTFALIFSVSFAVPFEWLSRVLGGRRILASVIYTVVLITIVALPLVFIISALRHHVKDAIIWMNDIRTNGLPPLPGWVTNLPLVGGGHHHFLAAAAKHSKGNHCFAWRAYQDGDAACSYERGGDRGNGAAICGRHYYFRLLFGRGVKKLWRR